MIANQKDLVSRMEIKNSRTQCALTMFFFRGSTRLMKNYSPARQVDLIALFF